MSIGIFRFDSIKKKLFVSSTMLVVVPLACVIVLLSYSLGQKSERDFLARATGEMTHVGGESAPCLMMYLSIWMSLAITRR